jgi:hypothetical protein
MIILLAWLKSKNWSTHAIGAGLVTIFTIISTSQQAQQFLVTMFQAHPVIASQIVLLATIVVTYKRSSSPAGTVAQSKAIMASDDPPTATEIKAANTANPPAA